MYLLIFLILSHGFLLLLFPFLNLYIWVCCRNLESNEDEFDTLLAEMEKEISIADVMREMGYRCTVNDSQCKDMLSLFLPLTESTVARILGTVACTHADLDDNQNSFLTFCSALGTSSLSDLPSTNSWNIDVLVDSIKQLVSSILLHR